MYKGSTVSQSRCMECGDVRERVEVVYAVDVNVLGHADLVSSLAKSTEFEDMVDSNAVECPVCMRKVHPLCVSM